MSEREYYDLPVRVHEMPYPRVDFAQLLEYGLVSHSDSDALRDICGRVVQVLGVGEYLRMRFFRLGDSFRTRAMCRAAAQPSMSYSYYQQYGGVLHGHVDVQAGICHPTRVVIVAGTVQGIPDSQIKLAKIDDP